MKKYIYLLKYELKNMLSDKMNLFMLFYPVLMVVILGVVMPLSMKSIPSEQLIGIMPLMFVVCSTIGAMGGGMLLGFSIVENKDERTINTIAVTPLSISGYVIFKAIYCCVISFVGNIVFIYGLKLFSSEIYLTFDPAVGIVNMFDLLNVFEVVGFSLVASLLTPTMGLLLGALAKNKVEAMVQLKVLGILIMLPALIVIPGFSGAIQYVLGVFPNFWCVKALANEVMFIGSTGDLSFWLYIVIGVAYSLVICYLSYRLFIKKLQIST